MDVDLDEDFANFESVSQMVLASPVDEELILLDREVTRREHQFQDIKRERNNNHVRRGTYSQTPSENDEIKEKRSCQRGREEEDKCSSSSFLGESDSKIFTEFPFDTGSKRLTMIPVKYKLKDERRKILKISVNKLKKIEDPESWLCRSVLINNTMKKLQRETRDEKIQKHLADVSMSFSANLTEVEDSEHCHCRLNPGTSFEIENGGANNGDGSVIETGFASSNKCCGDEINDDFEIGEIDVRDRTIEETFFPAGENLEKVFYRERVKLKNNDKTSETRFHIPVETVEFGLYGDLEQANGSLFQPTDRCLSRKDCSIDVKSRFECPLINDQRQKLGKTDEVDDCDVHDVLSQLYLPPTPRMLTSIDSDTDEDELTAVEHPTTEYGKLPVANFSEAENRLPKRSLQEDDGDDEVECCSKRWRLSDEGSATNDRVQRPAQENADKKLSRSLSCQYQSKGAGDGFFEENCDSQYSCGQAVSMFGGDLQAVAFHNLIAGLET